MTDPEKRIEALVHTVPTVTRTRGQKVLRWAAVFFAALATVTFGLTVSNIYGTAQLAACTNTNLGTRSVPTANDAKAHIAFAKAVEGLFLPESASTADRADAVALFKATTIAYVQQLETDQAMRNQHPLGKC